MSHFIRMQGVKNIQDKNNLGLVINVLIRRVVLILSGLDTAFY